MSTDEPVANAVPKTFELHPDVGGRFASVVGEFNDWDPGANPMDAADDGSLTATIDLRPGRSYRFRYLLDDGRWENDWNADSYTPNDFGGDDSVVHVEESRPLDVVIGEEVATNNPMPVPEPAPEAEQLIAPTTAKETIKDTYRFGSCRSSGRGGT